MAAQSVLKITTPTALFLKSLYPQRPQRRIEVMVLAGGPLMKHHCLDLDKSDLN
jgi:hypothetical protein